ncbi:MAG TPA: outer membrane beta-barrel protein, partial [Haliangium sp.]|nr:outer membrane beta-barrel protein [Haliangium sp.]
MMGTIRFQARYQRSTTCRLRGSDIWLMLPALGACLCGQGQALAEPGRVELGVTVAPSMDTHAGERRFSQNTYKQGWSASAALRYGLSDAWSLQGELVQATRGTNLELEGEIVSSFNFRYLQIPLLARYARPLPGWTGDDGRPLLHGHLVVGPALGFLVRAEDLDDDRILPRSSVRSLDVTVTAGLGVTWRFTPRWAASVEARIDRGFFNVFSASVESKNQAVLLALGVGYTLNDGDNDGVSNPRDQCPTGAEDWNYYQDADGCPDDDADEDGVAVVNDRCLEDREDRDGFEDTDGCPDPDNDGDTILDEEDNCPDEPFSYNRALLHNQRGCPPRPDRVNIEAHRVMSDPMQKRVLLVPNPRLEFDEKQFVLTADQKLALDEVAELLTDYYPRMRLRLEGYADSEGKSKA